MSFADGIERSETQLESQYVLAELLGFALSISTTILLKNCYGFVL